MRTPLEPYIKGVLRSSSTQSEPGPMGSRLPRESERPSNPKLSVMTSRTGVASSETVLANGYSSPKKGTGHEEVRVQRSRQKEERSWGDMVTNGLGYHFRYHSRGQAEGLADTQSKIELDWVPGIRPQSLSSDGLYA